MKNWQKVLTVVASALLFCQFNMQGASEGILWEDEEARDFVAQQDRTIYFDDPALKAAWDDKTENGYGGSLHFKYLNGSLALTGERCAINKTISALKVATTMTSLGNILDDDLDNTGLIVTGVDVGLTVNPVLSIRDQENYYAKGTTAGFCLGAGSGDTALALDVISAMSIGFYRDGKLIGSVACKEGQAGSGVTLSLINVPGTDQSCMNVTAEAPGIFDEISLDLSGGLQVGVGKTLYIKYAFVGRPSQFTITKDQATGSVSVNNQPTAFQQYSPENADVDLDYVKGYNPVLLGLPFPVLQNELDKFTDDDFDNYMALTPIIAVGYQGGAKFMMKHKNDPLKEVYAPGTEVGFNYKYGAALTLDLGAWITIVLFDRNGNNVKSYDLKGTALALSVAKGGDGSSSIISDVPFSGAEIRFHTTVGVDLGAMGVHYAFVREPAMVRHHCPINPSRDMNLCVEQPSFQLRSNPDVSVTWTMDYDRCPAGTEAVCTASGAVSGLDIAGEYTFVATAADGCRDEVTIYYGMADGDIVTCGSTLTNVEGETPLYRTTMTEDLDELSGGLINIDRIKNDYDNILKDDDSYVIYQGGLKVAEHIAVVGVRRIDGNPIYYGKNDIYEKGIRVGFNIQSKVVGLNLNALKFFNIICYLDGHEVYRDVVDESNAVSLGLAEADNGQRGRFSITVPAVNPNPKEGDDYYIKFDQVVLWDSGLLGLDGSDLYIFSAFVDEVDSPCSDPLGCDYEVLSSKTTHTTYNFNAMDKASTVAAGSFVNNYDHLIDDDLETATQVNFTANVGGGETLAINLGRTLDYHHQLGLVMDDKTFALGVEAGSWISFMPYYHGQPTGERIDDWGAVGADVAGFGDKKIVLIHSKYIFDELRIEIGTIASVAKEFNLLGLILRDDTDNDGIPDCMDDCSCFSNVSLASVEDVCMGDYIRLPLKGANATQYKVSSSDPSFKAAFGAEDVTFESSQETGEFEIEYLANTSGQFSLLICDVSGTPINSIPYCVHPRETTWLRTASNTDWDKWDNWSNGTPYCCTNVIIPTGANHYPDLVKNVTVGNEYCCDKIHFAPRAEINSVHKLNYTKAWAELEMMPNRYYLLSAPFRKMYTGDMFIPKDMEGIHTGDYFADLDAKASPENRFNPTIFQRLWSASASERKWGEGYEPVGTEQLEQLAMTKWSRNFNFLAHEYKKGTGFSVWVDNGELSDALNYRFRFPKEHTLYNYYDDFTQSVVPDVNEGPDKLIRAQGDRKVTGRFITEEEIDLLDADKRNGKVIEYTTRVVNAAKEEILDKRTVYTGALPQTITLALEENSDHFLFGNPFMSNINIEKFLAHNADQVSGLMEYDGNTARSIRYGESGRVASTTEKSVIAPMEAVFLTAVDSRNSVTLEITEDMLLNDNSTVAEQAKALRIVLSDGQFETAMTVVDPSEQISNAALLDNEVAPSISVYGIEDGMGMDIMNAAEQTPLMIINRDGRELKMSFKSFAGFPRDEYKLLDVADSTFYPLDMEIVLPAGMRGSAGRYVLYHESMTTAVDKVVEDADVYVEVIGDDMIVKSLAAGIVDAKVYDLNGQLLDMAPGHEVNEVRLDASAGLRLVTVSTADGKTHRFKLYIR